MTKLDYIIFNFQYIEPKHVLIFNILFKYSTSVIFHRGHLDFCDFSISHKITFRPFKWSVTKNIEKMSFLLLVFFTLYFTASSFSTKRYTNNNKLVSRFKSFNIIEVGVNKKLEIIPNSQFQINMVFLTYFHNCKFITKYMIYFYFIESGQRKWTDKTESIIWRKCTKNFELDFVLTFNPAVF